MDYMLPCSNCYSDTTIHIVERGNRISLSQVSGTYWSAVPLLLHRPAAAAAARAATWQKWCRRWRWMSRCWVWWRCAYLATVFSVSVKTILETSTVSCSYVPTDYSSRSSCTFYYRH